MKKVSISTIIFVLIFSIQGFSQNGSVLIQPSNDEVLATKHGGSEPNLAGRFANGTASVPTATLSGNALTSFSGRGHTGSGFTGDRARITMWANENFASTANGTRMTFLTTANGTTSLTERMRISHDGLVGIGTSSPERLLHIYSGNSGGSSFNNTRLFVEGSTNTYVSIASPETNETGVLFSKPSSTTSGGIVYNSSNTLQLFSGGSARMRILSTGKIGINESSPTARLQITHDGSDADPHLRIHTTGLYSRINWSTNTNSNVFTAQTDIESGTSSNNYWRLEYNGSTRLFVRGDGKVGIGTTTPTAKLDIEGDIVVKKITNAITGTINALSRNSGSSIFMNGTGTVTLNGIAGGVDGMVLYLICGNSTTLLINHENTNAAAADRITTQTAGQISINQRGGAVLIYEGLSQKWRIIGFAN